MFKLDRIDKAYREAGSFNERVNLFGFIDEHVFLTKAGDVGAVLSVEGVDYECLDSAALDNLTKRLESAFKIFDEKCRVYQYLFKRNHAEIPHQSYDNPIVHGAIRNRIEYLDGKADEIYSLKIYYVILFEGFRYQQRLLTTLGKFASEPRQALKELPGFLSTKKQLVLIDTEVEKARTTLTTKVRNFALQVSDFLKVEVLSKDAAFGVLKTILNFSPRKTEGAKLNYETFLDYSLCESHLECHRGFLRLDDYFVKTLTLKEPSAQSFALIFKRLLEIQANFYVVTEWKKQSPDKTRSLIHSRRRHFHNTKRSFMSHLSVSNQPENPQDILVDDSKEAQVRDLGRALEEVELKGNHFGEFSLTVVVYDQNLAKAETACADFGLTTRS
jgi:type IV secretory pathway VirB4 component